MNVQPPTGSERDRLAAGVGAVLAQARLRAGLSRAELARAAGVGEGTVSSIERGASRPAWKTLARCAFAIHPNDPEAAGALGRRLAEAAGPSLAGRGDLPVTVTRETVVRVLGAAAARLGMPLDDDYVRSVVLDELARATGEAAPAPVRLAITAAVVAP